MTPVYSIIFLLLLANIGLLIIAGLVLRLAKTKSKDLVKYYSFHQHNKSAYRN